ncbi:MAG TPA: hypothetical protein DCX77_11865 [Acidimicrobiaceae bacterium]|nr:hypothetical protein [Acidimicrobiaceae bacterium]
MTNSDQRLEFECPRCSEAACQPFYGPCESCRDDLRQMFVAESKDVENKRYEPKMNVTPNAVATKE